MEKIKPKSHQNKKTHTVGNEAKPLKKVNKPYKIRREGSFVSGFR